MASAFALHARTAAQLYDGEARLERTSPNSAELGSTSPFSATATYLGVARRAPHDA
jgi:tRNA-dihydrouridine synthase